MERQVSKQFKRLITFLIEEMGISDASTRLEVSKQTLLNIMNKGELPATDTITISAKCRINPWKIASDIDLDACMMALDGESYIKKDYLEGARTHSRVPRFIIEVLEEHFGYGLVDNIEKTLQIKKEILETDFLLSTNLTSDIMKILQNQYNFTDEQIQKIGELIVHYSSDEEFEASLKQKERRAILEEIITNIVVVENSFHYQVTKSDSSEIIIRKTFNEEIIDELGGRSYSHPLGCHYSKGFLLGLVENQLGKKVQSPLMRANIHQNGKFTEWCFSQ